MDTYLLIDCLLFKSCTFHSHFVFVTVKQKRRPHLTRLSGGFLVIRLYENCYLFVILPIDFSKVDINQTTVGTWRPEAYVFVCRLSRKRAVMTTCLWSIWVLTLLQKVCYSVIWYISAWSLSLCNTVELTIPKRSMCYIPVETIIKTPGAVVQEWSFLVHFQVWKNYILCFCVFILSNLTILLG